jgi:hypothetical protein
VISCLQARGTIDREFGGRFYQTFLLAVVWFQKTSQRVGVFHVFLYIRHEAKYGKCIQHRDCTHLYMGGKQLTRLSASVPTKGGASDGQIKNFST